MSTPAARGFHMPAEWQPHDRCWMAWPCREKIWYGRLEEARAAYAEVARAVVEFEPVTMIANPADVATASLACGRGVEVLPVDIDDSWTRDNGPTFVVDGKGGIAGCDWRFNCWGEEYEDYDNDARLAGALLAHQEIQRFEAPFVLEGGAIHTDGEGTLLTTESVLLNPNRNPEMSREETEQALCDWLGVAKIIWLPEGLHEDETDGHVDNVACFARPGVVIAGACPDKSDPNYEICEANLDVLRSATDGQCRALEVLTLDQPTGMEEDGRRLASSYVNFYIANDGIVMPGFDDKRDNAAYKTVAQAFPGRTVTQVPATDIIRGGGCIHCITQQQPQAD